MLDRSSLWHFAVRHRVSVASWSALSMVIAVLAFYSANNLVYPVHHADLNDGGVWVTSSDLHVVARENKPVGQADALFDVPNAQSLDVLQAGSAVVQTDGSTMTPVDVSTGMLDKSAPATTKGDTALLGGGALLNGVTTPVGVVSLDRSSGKAWVGYMDAVTGAPSLGGLSAPKPAINAGGSSAAGAVSVYGTAFVASGAAGGGGGNLVTLYAPGFGNPTAISSALSPRPVGGIKSVTAIGDQPAVLDSAGGLIVPSGARVSIGSDAILQQPSAPDGVNGGSGKVFYADSSGLHSVSLSGGSPQAEGPANAVSGTPSQPVVVGSCAFGVWTAPDGTAQVESNCGTPYVMPVPNVIPGADLRLRVNRNEIVLNDVKNGSLWAVSRGKVSQLQSLQTASQQNKNKATKPSPAHPNPPPNVPPQNLGARANNGVTVLHVLDKASAAKDAILAIVGKPQSSNPAVQVTVGPDEQTLLAYVPRNTTGSAQIKFTVDDGLQRKNSIATGTVNLSIKSPDAPGVQPKLRDNYSRGTWQVAVGGGSIDIPITADWRNKQTGDPVVLKSVTQGSMGMATVLPTGVLHFAAPDAGNGGTVNLRYVVSSGGIENTDSVSVHVLGTSAAAGAPHPQDDVVSGTVGSTMTVRPLANDVPGADPLDPSAPLTLAGAQGAAGLTVVPNPGAGTIAITASRTGTFEIPYEVTQASAGKQTGHIRIDVGPSSAASSKPVTVPVNVVVRGTAPAVVDVLAADYDPQGRVLVVQDAAPDTAPGTTSQMNVSVLNGHWLRISASTTKMSPTTQIVKYDVSNGPDSAIGTVSVTQLPALSGDDTPVAEPNIATVRVGDAVDVPVLANASTPSGSPVTLVVPTPPAAPAFGQLQVIPAGTGTAYVVGNQIRYVAPATGSATTVHVAYTVANLLNPNGATATGLLTLHITPPVTKLNPDNPPTPLPITGRVFEGQTVTLKLPQGGEDPDGDSVSITGITGAPASVLADPPPGPQLGRVISVGANSITYQAFPGASGTDTFGYTATDTYGKSATGTVQIGVVPPGALAPPVAQPVNVTAAPGRKIAVDVLASVLKAQGEKVWLSSVNGKTPSDGSAPIVVNAPGSVGQPLGIPFTVTNGLATSKNMLTITAQPGYDNAPQVNDIVATPKKPADTTVTVDVLSHVYDIDDSIDQLKIKSVALKTAVIAAQKVTLTRTATPQVIPFVVADAEGATTSASIYVPALPNGTPYLKTGATIQLDRGGSKVVQLSDVVVSPDGKPLYLTYTNTLFPKSSSLLSVTAHGRQAIKVSATSKTGPGEVSFEVSDSSNPASPTAHTAIINVPVQVGADVPVITCPSGIAASVFQGGDPIQVSVASVCQVWTSNPSAAAGLKYSAAWSQSIANVHVIPTPSGFTLSADGNAAYPATGSVKVSAQGSQPAVIKIATALLPPPYLDSIAPIASQLGQTVTLDLANSLHTDVAQAKRHIVITNIAPRGAGVTSNGSILTFKPAGYIKKAAYSVTVNDTGGHDPRRSATIQIYFSAIAPPTKPGAPVWSPLSLASGYVTLSWAQSQSNGSRIDRYIVHFTNADHNGSYPCQVDPCAVKVPNSDKPYKFTVQAHNGASANGGLSAMSAPGTGYANTAPGPVTNLHVVQEGEKNVRIGWNAPLSNGSKGTPYYRVTCSCTGTPTSGQTGTSLDVGGLQDGVKTTATVYSFITVAGRTLITQQAPTIDLYAAGQPDAPPVPTVTQKDIAGTTNGVNVNIVANPPADLRGKSPAYYQFLRDGVVIPGCDFPATAISPPKTSCDDPLTYNGTTYQYTVKVRNASAYDPSELQNQAAHTSGASPSVSYQAAKVPESDAINSFDETAGSETAAPPSLSSPGTSSATISFTVNASHGAQANVQCQLNGADCSGSITPQSGNTAGWNGTGTFSGLTNGTPYTVQIRTCNGSAAATDCGSWVSAQLHPQAAPYGAIGRPTVSASYNGPGSGSANISAQVNPNGAPVTVTITGNDGYNWTSGQITQPQTVNAPQDTGEWNKSNVTYTATVNDAGGSGVSRTPQSSSPSSPSINFGGQPSISPYNAGQAPNPTGNCSVATCWYFGATMSNFPPGTYGWCEIQHQGTNYNNQHWWYRTASPADGNGNFTGRLDGGSHGPLAWSSNPYGSGAPPYDNGGCRQTPDTSDGSAVMTY